MFDITHAKVLITSLQFFTQAILLIQTYEHASLSPINSVGNYVLSPPVAFLGSEVTFEAELIRLSLS